MNAERLYELPNFLKGRASQDQYERWLSRKAATHLKRDRKRVPHEITGKDYRQLMHAAVCRSEGNDFYTGEHLAWEKISTYSNDESKEERSTYKAGFALLPTVDHIMGDDGKYNFAICGWRTNDAKNDLNYAEFLDLCRLVLRHHEECLSQLQSAFRLGS
jgi:hypothetical protein